MEREPAEVGSKLVEPGEAAALLVREARHLWETQHIEESVLRLEQAALLLRQSVDRNSQDEARMEAITAIRSAADQFWELADGAAAFWRGVGTVSGVDAGGAVSQSDPDGKVEEI